MKLDRRKFADCKTELDGTRPIRLDLPDAGPSEDVFNDFGEKADAWRFQKGIHEGARIKSESINKHMGAMRGEELTDDVSGEKLDLGKNIEFVKCLGVYAEIPKAEALKSGLGKIISGRWIDINKGDWTTPDHRLR